MGLFKSAEERRVERDIKIRQGVRRIEKSIREQGKFQDEFIRNARSEPVWAMPQGPGFMPRSNTSRSPLP